MIVNDLDIVIEGPGSTIYYPYKLDPNNPSNPAITANNSVDNVEQVHIESPIAGNYIVRISHKGTLIGGIEEGEQAFSF